MVGGGIFAVLVLVGYNALHTPQSLISSLLVILTVVLFELFYRRLRDGDRPMSSFMDKRLEHEETRQDKI